MNSTKVSSKINDKHLNYYHTVRDPEVNQETTPPSEEKIRIPSIWVFEVFPPEYIDNFYQSVNNLGWADERLDAFDDFPDTLHDMRHRASGGGWINLGYIVQESASQTLPRSRTANLPTGVESIRMSLWQPMPSTTILISQFNFKDNLSSVLDDCLHEKYKTYTKKTNSGRAFISVEHQKKEAVNVNREYLNNICSEWLKEKFAGYYASGLTKEEHPVCTLLTLENNIPFSDNPSRNDYMSMLNINHSYDVWKSDNLKGLYLQTHNEKNVVRKSLTLSGNVNEILSDEELDRHGTSKSSKIVNYLECLDNTLGTWILNILLDSYIYKISDLRDLYGKAVSEVGNQTISTITSLDHQVLQSQKNIIPFIFDLHHYCSEEINFMYDVYEFDFIKKRSKEKKLFTSMREVMLYKLDLLTKNEKSLRETANATRQINSIISSDNLAISNIKMQKSMQIMTIIILILTVISTGSALGWDNIKDFFNSLIVYVRINDGV